METTPGNTGGFNRFGRGARSTASPGRQGAEVEVTGLTAEESERLEFRNAGTTRTETVYCDDEGILSGTPPIVIPIPHENRYVTVAYKKSDARPGTWSPVREPLTDYIETRKNTEHKNVKFNEKVKKFVYDNKESDDDELELHAKDELDWELKKTIQGTNRKELTYDSDRMHVDSNKTENKRKLIKAKNKVLTRDSDTDSDGESADYTGKRATPEFRPSVLRLRATLDVKERLRGSANYDPWRQKIVRILHAEGLDEFIEREMKDIKMDAVIKSRTNAAVYEIIHTNLAENVQTLIANIPNAVEAWRKLERVYSTKTTDGIITGIDGLRFLEFKESDDGPTFFAKCDLVYAKLAKLGINLQTEFRTGYVISLLYESLPTVASTLSNIPCEQLTMEIIQEKVEKEMELRKRKEQRKTPAYDPRPTAATTGYGPKKIGVPTGPRRMTIGDSSGYDRRCYRCQSTEHDTSTCPQPDMRRCYRCGKVGHIGKNCPEQTDTGVYINVFVQNRIVNPIFDTGATTTIVPDRDLLTQAGEIATPVPVTLTNGNILKLKVKGTLTLTWGEGKELKITDAYVAEGTTDIIVSAAQLLKQHGYRCVMDANRAFVSSGREADDVKYELTTCGNVYRFTACSISATAAMYENDGNFAKKVIRGVPAGTPNNASNKVTNAICNNNKCNNVSISQPISFMDEKVGAGTRKGTGKEALVWHRRMGHAGFEVVRQLHRYVLGAAAMPKSGEMCRVCMEAKLTAKTYRQTREIAKRPGYRTHMDLVGPITPMAGGQKRIRYLLTMVDDYSRYATVHLLKTKKETATYIKQYLDYIRTRFPRPGQLAMIRTDGGTEFVNKKVTKLLEDFGMTRETSEPYAHQHNGTAERFNRTVQEKIRALLFDAGYPVTFWGHAALAATYLYNRTPHATNNNHTPYELFTGRKPDVKHLRIFGSMAYVHLSGTKKLQKRARQTFIVGYTDTGYLVYDPATAKIEPACDVRVDETRNYGDVHGGNREAEGLLTFHGSESGEDVERVTEDESTCKKKDETMITNGRGGKEGYSEGQWVGGSGEDSRIVRDISHRTLSLPSNMTQTETQTSETEEGKTDAYSMDGDWDPIGTSTQAVNAVMSGEQGKRWGTTPKSFKQACSPEWKDRWEPAINKELTAMAEHAAWDIVPREQQDKPLPCAWKFSIKDDGTPKARLYLVGNREPIDSLQNTYAPVADLMVLFWMCSMAVKHKTDIYQLDVTTAFLNAPLDEPRLMRIPEGLDADRTRYVCKLKRAIYGLRISPRLWYLTMGKTLTDLGLKQSVHEPCLFYSINEKRFVLLALYVDDLLITGTDGDRIRSIRQRLGEIYTIKDLGIATKFLGMEIKRDNTTHSLTITQTDYISELIRTMKLDEANEKPTPMARFGNFPTTKTSDYLPNETEYRSIIGKLQFVASHTRPDIAYAVNCCARYQQAPERIHWKLTQRILRYLKGTKELGLSMTAIGDGITGFADADHHQCVETRRSTTGYVIKYNGDTITWRSARQRSRGNSTTDSELIAVNSCARRAKGLANIVAEIFSDLDVTIKLYQDNTSTIARLADPTAIGMIKDIDARDKYVIQLVRDGRARVFYLPTTEMLADPLTKPLDKEAFCRHRTAMLQSIEEATAAVERKLTETERRATDGKAEYLTLRDLQVGLTGIFGDKR